MKKYRIAQTSKSSFIPQSKGLIFWSGWMLTPYGGTKSFSSLEEARKFIDKYHEEYHSNDYPVIHEHRLIKDVETK